MWLLWLVISALSCLGIDDQLIASKGTEVHFCDDINRINKLD